MRKVGGNDILEVLAWPPGDTQPRYAHTDLSVLDQRAQMARQLIAAWGAMAALGDVLPTCEGIERPERVPPTVLVMRICEVVDAAWNEFEHRGWVVKSPSLGDDE